jgi:hypothetical protein
MDRFLIDTLLGNAGPRDVSYITAAR